MLAKNSKIISWKLPKTPLKLILQMISIYYAYLDNGSTNSSVIEQVVVYLFFLCEDTPTVKYLRVEPVKTAEVAGVIESIETEFNQFGITSSTDRMSGLNVDGASINVGVHRRVSTQLVISRLPW